MPPVGSEGADSSSDDEDQADWAQNPLFDQGDTTPFSTPVRSGQAGVEAAALRCLPTPQRLDFAIADLARLGQADQSGSLVPAVGVSSTGVVVNRGVMADGLAGRLGVLGLGTGGASSSGGGGAGSRWPGDAGMSFCLHRIDVEPKVAQAQAKGWSPAQQFGVIAAQILPMSPGARVHDVVVRALDPFIRAALQGLPIGVEALVISTLEHLRTGSVHVTGTIDVLVPAAPAAG